ncbi:hypothetical protein PVAP13_5KG073500 [Panicum virgatum]|uniref:Uncharacterized protein n=1 Tax=Panicum virgatum TaxID=38727 RepID=A0A8T0SEC2_PANVG|nr:hypothetical protein PVAP13_5KG073500 [Panicum virgatum]
MAMPPAPRLSLFMIVLVLVLVTASPYSSEATTSYSPGFAGVQHGARKLLSGDIPTPSPPAPVPGPPIGSLPTPSALPPPSPPAA